MRTTRRIGPILLSAALAVAACGGDDGGSDGAGGGGDATDAPGTDSTAPEASSAGSTPSEATGSGSLAPDGEPVAGGELTVLHVSNPSSLDPVSGGSGHDHMSLYPLYDRLLNFEPETLEALPGLATAWEQPDPETLVLTLQDGVTFHDGTPFDAEAVKFNLDRSLTLDTSTVKADLAMIDSVEVSGPLEATIHLNRPDASLALILADRAGMMVSPTAAEESGEDFGMNPVGTGPFSFVEWLPNDRLVVAKNAEYWQEGKPYLDQLTIRYIPDPQAAMNAIQTRQVDVALKVPSDRVETIDVEGLDIVVQPSLGTDVCYFNFSRAPFDDPDVRRAATLAIDRDTMNEAQAHGQGQPAHQIFPPGYWAADPDRADALAYDPDQASQLLASAGYADGVEIRALAYDGPGEMRKAEIVQAQLGEIGIDMNVEVMDVGAATSTFFESLSYDMYCAGWSGRPDPSQTVNSLFSADAFYNAGGYDSPGMADAIAAAGSRQDQPERAAAFAEIVQISQDDALFLPLIHQPDITAIYSDIGGLTTNLYGKVDVSFLWREQ